MADKKKFTKPSFLITAGPTREYLDPARFLSNPSTGKMGVSLANEAKRSGARVTLCLGPIFHETDKNISIKRFCSAEDLNKIVIREIKKHDILIMAAAVSDYRPQITYQKKIKKHAQKILLPLKKNPDIFQEVSKELQEHHKFLIGFAAETENLNKNALQKLEKKHMHMIIANHVYKEKKGFSSDRNNVKVFVRGPQKAIASFMGTKKSIAKKIFPIIIKEYKKHIVNF